MSDAMVTVSSRIPQGPLTLTDFDAITLLRCLGGDC